MKSKEYQFYTARDFALDDDFHEWALHPNPKNSVFWESWIKGHPQKQATINEALALIRFVQFDNYTLTNREKDQLWDAIWDKIDHEEMEFEFELSLSKKQNNWHHSRIYIAATLISIVTMFSIWQTSNHQSIKAFSFSEQTQFGEIKELFLPDSSEVILNANSKLVYMEKNNKEREAWIIGEAYFHVKHTYDNKGFTVHTYDNVSVEVLGTRFNVNSFGKAIAVVLQEGSIKLDIGRSSDPGKTQLYLKPGEMIHYNKHDGDYIKSSVNTGQYVSWTNGRLVMDNYSLKDVSAFMKQVFNKKVVIPDQHLLDTKISGSMPIVYNVDTMLTQFGKVFQIHFHKQGDEIRVQE